MGRKRRYIVYQYTVLLLRVKCNGWATYPSSDELLGTLKASNFLRLWTY